MSRDASRTVRVALAVAITALLSGCTGHQQSVTYKAPIKYPAVKQTWVFEYSNVDIRKLKEVLFPEFLTLAESSFNGPYEDPTSSRSFASSLGADVFIVSTQYSRTWTLLVPLTVPPTSTSFGTSFVSIPATMHVYDQTGLYLRNVKNVSPLWVRTRQHYPPTGKSEFDGGWKDDKYGLEVYRSGNQIVGVVSRPSEAARRNGWGQNDVKFVFGADTGRGVYLMGDRTPMPVESSINDFGFLEFKLAVGSRSISFARE